MKFGDIFSFRCIGKKISKIVDKPPYFCYTQYRSYKYPKNGKPWETRGRKAPSKDGQSGLKPERNLVMAAELPKVIMKIKLLLLVVLIIFLGLPSGVENKCATTTGVLQFNGIPEASLDFNDLDARDANNQPIATQSKKQELVQLFQSSLFTLLVNSEIHIIAESLAMVRISLNLSAHVMKAVTQKAKELFAAFIGLRRKLKDFIIFFPYLLFLSQLVFLTIKTSVNLIPPSNLAPLVLRC